jgi:DHA2 family multidrug resistance protein-like MFS transporter
VSVPVMILLLVLGPVLLPEFRDPEAGPVDLLSAALSLVAVLAVIYGLKRIAQDGLGWLPALAIAAGVAVGVVFVNRQRKLADPLIDLRLFRIPAFSASLATYAVGTFVAFGIFVFTGQYLQLVLGLSPLRAGMWTMPFAGAFIVGSMLTPAIARRIRPGFVIAGGLALAAVGFGMLTQLDGPSPLAVLVTGFVVYSLGLAPVFTLATDLIVGTAPPERAGAAAAISETGSEFGGALGIAILGSIGTAMYRGKMADTVPHTVPPEAAAAARDTLGGAVAAAERLSGELGAELLVAAREAFARALDLTAVVSTAVVIATAVVAVIFLRQVPPGSEAEAALDTTAEELEAG